MNNSNSGDMISSITRKIRITGDAADRMDLNNLYFRNFFAKSRAFAIFCHYFLWLLCRKVAFKSQVLSRKEEIHKSRTSTGKALHFLESGMVYVQKEVKWMQGVTDAHNTNEAGQCLQGEGPDAMWPIKGNICFCAGKEEKQM